MELSEIGRQRNNSLSALVDKQKYSTKEEKQCISR